MNIFDPTDRMMNQSVEASQGHEMTECCNCHHEIGDPDDGHRWSDEVTSHPDIYCGDCIIRCADCNNFVPKGKEDQQGWNGGDCWLCPTCQEDE